MYGYIFIIVINILLYYYIKRKLFTDNPYTKERVIFDKKKIHYILRIINIFNIIFNGLLYIILLLNNSSISLIGLLLYITSIISYIIIEIDNEYKKVKFKLIDKKIITKSEVMYILSLIVILISCHISPKTTQLDLILCIVVFLIILASLVSVLRVLMQNKDILCFSPNEGDYLEDIKFTKKIELNKVFNYTIYILAFIMFVYIRIPYIFILYILIALILLYYIYKKAKKIESQSSRVYKSITIAKTFPGIVYAFQFTRDILLFKKLIITLISFIISILVLYGIGETSFSFIAIELYVLLLYTIIKDKIYLIRYIGSINDSYINKKIYTISEIKPITYIDKIKIFNITLYKLIIIDTIVYESNIIFYDPEIILNEIEIRIKKSNIEDYITIENILYEE